MHASSLKVSEAFEPQALGDTPDARSRHATVTTQIATAILWLAGSDAVAALVAERLRDLNISVRQFPESAAAHDRPSDVSPSKIPALTLIEGGSARQVKSDEVQALWRGGLAPGALRRVKDHVDSLLFDRIDVSELAKLVDLSECHFSRAFRQSVGVPPHRYILARRIDAAADLIENTERALADIAVSVGFSDQSHFTRTFVRFTGETPRAFRHRHR